MLQLFTSVYKCVVIASINSLPAKPVFIFMGAVTFSFQRNFYEAINCKMLPEPDRSKIIPPLSVQKSRSPCPLTSPPLSVIFALNDFELTFQIKID